MMRVVGCFVYVALETWKFSPCLPTSWRRCGCCSAARGFVPSYSRAGAVLRNTPPPMTPMTARTPGGAAQGGGVFANPMLASLASPRATGGATGDGSSGSGWRPTSAALTFSPMRPGSGVRDVGGAPSDRAGGPAAHVSSAQAGTLAPSAAWPGGQLAPGDVIDTAPDAGASSVAEGDKRTVVPATTGSDAAAGSAGPLPSLPAGSDETLTAGPGTLAALPVTVDLLIDAGAVTVV